MREAFRRMGRLRFTIGVAIIVAAFVLRGDIGEVWTGVLVLVGSVVAVSGVATVLFMVIYVGVLPFVFHAVIWLTSTYWDGMWFSDHVRKNAGFTYFWWILGLLTVPLHFYYGNRSWFFMARNFGLDEPPVDTQHPELYQFGVVDLTGSIYFAAVTITEQGIIIDRRHFDTVVLPWRWVRSVDADPEADPRVPKAIVAMRNDDNEFLTLSIPLNRDLLNLDVSKLLRGDTD